MGIRIPVEDGAPSVSFGNAVRSVLDAVAEVPAMAAAVTPVPDSPPAAVLRPDPGPGLCEPLAPSRGPRQDCPRGKAASVATRPLT